MNALKLKKQIEQIRTEAQQAKERMEFEFAFVLLDKAASLENQLQTSQ